jgi:putative serine protease PepD
MDATGQFAALGGGAGGHPTQQVPPYGSGGGPGAWQQPAPFGAQPAKPRAARRWLAAGAAAVVLVLGGGVVGGVTVHALDGNGVTESPVVSTPVSSKGGSLANMVAQVQPSVVSLKVQPDNSQSGDEGSGVIIRSDGMILTNNHVVSSVADGGGTITVTFSDGKQASAKVVGTDPAGDLAVVQAQGKSGLKPATLGDSSKMRVGDGVVAIGSPLGLEGSVTQGIVSALNRSYSVAAEDQQPQQQNQNPFNFGQPRKNQQQQQGSGSTVTIPNAIQTDAAINPGNSGGPLLNMAGQVIGINSAIRGADSSSGQAGNIGIGFAIPINTAKSTADQLIDGKKVQHALFGVKVGDAVSDGQGASGTPQGALVADVTKGGPADKAGLKKGDVITEVDGTQVTDSASLVSVISAHKPGDKVKITYSRNGSTKTTTATLTKSPN